MFFGAEWDLPSARSGTEGGLEIHLGTINLAGPSILRNTG